jgi:hypothetical protein
VPRLTARTRRPQTSPRSSSGRHTRQSLLGSRQQSSSPAQLRRSGTDRQTAVVRAGAVSPSRPAEQQGIVAPSAAGRCVPPLFPRSPAMPLCASLAAKAQGDADRTQRINQLAKFRSLDRSLRVYCCRPDLPSSLESGRLQLLVTHCHARESIADRIAKLGRAAPVSRNGLKVSMINNRSINDHHVSPQRGVVIVNPDL